MLIVWPRWASRNIFHRSQEAEGLRAHEIAHTLGLLAEAEGLLRCQ
jgi:hypothetical protein